MIPIVQRWGKNIHISAQQLLIPLSFASILGGTCTLIGTSTNLVVVGLLNKRYKDDPDVQVQLFDLSIYGVPVAVIGIAYVILTSSFLLPGGSGRRKSNRAGTVPLEMASDEDVLLGAMLMPWSPAAGRSVKRSGLRDTGGIYLVSVHRAATGNVHRAVGQDFVLNVGDVLYFTGLVEGFGDFCEEHGMEMLTNDHLQSLEEKKDQAAACNGIEENKTENETPKEEEKMEEEETPFSKRTSSAPLGTVVEGEETFENGDGLPVIEVGVTKESLLQADDAERSRSITRMIGKATLFVGRFFYFCKSLIRFIFSLLIYRRHSWRGSR